MEKELRIKLNTVADLKGIESVKRSFSELERETLRAVSSQQSMSSATSDTAKSFDNLSNRIGFMGHAYIGFQAAMASSSYMVDLTKDAIRQADTWNLLEGRLGLVTKSKQQLLTVEAELFDISQNSRTGYAQDADLYARIARSTEQLGKSQKDTLSVTEAISQSLVISGASAESANAALVQLGQGFASGVLRGEELNSVMEQSPRLALAIAQGMGVTIGQLRQMGADGKLTADAVFNAILKQKDSIEKEFGKMPVTVGQSMTVLQNQIGLSIHEFDQMHGVTKKVSDAIMDATKILSDHSSKIGDYIGYAGTAVSAILTWKVGTVALNTVQKLHAEYVAASTIATTSYNIATNTTAVSVTRLTAAQVALNMAMKANPWLIAGTAAIGLGAVLSNEMDKFNTASKSALSGIGDLRTTQAVQKEIDSTVNALKNSREKIANWDGFDSIFGNKAIEEKNAARLENRLKFLSGKLNDLGKVSEETAPKVNNAIYLTQAQIDKQQRAAESLKQAYLAINKDIAAFTGNDHEKAIASIDKQAEEYRKQKVDELTIAKYVSSAKTALIQKETEEQNKLLIDHYKSIGEDDAAYYMQLSSEIDAMVKKGIYSYDYINTYREDKDKEYLDKKAEKEANEAIKDYENEKKKIEAITQANIEYYTAIGDTSSAYYLQEEEKMKKLAETGWYTHEQMLAIKKSDDEKFQKEQWDRDHKFWADTFVNINKAMEDQFFNTMSGKFTSFGNWLKDFWSSITQSMSRGLSKSIADSIMGTNDSGGGIQNIFKSFGGLGSVFGSAATPAALIGATTDSAGFTTTAGGTVYDAAGQVTKQGSDYADVLNAINVASSAKTIYGALTGEISASIASGFGQAGAYLGELTGSASLAEGVGSFGMGLSSPWASAGAGGIEGAGAMLGGAALGAAGGYVLGSVGDKLLGADTKAGTYGAIGGTIGAVVGGPVGAVIGAALGSLVGGMFGSTKVKGSGYYFGSSTEDGSNAQTYVDYKKKSWFSSSSWTTYSPLSEVEKSKIKGLFDTYDYLLVQLGTSKEITLAAGRYAGTTFQDQLAKNFITAFTDVEQSSSIFSTIYSYWTDYAKSINQTISQAFATSIGTYVSSTRSFNEWKLGSGTVEQLKFTSEYLTKDLAALENQMGVSGITVENYLSKYDEAMKSSFTPETITSWKNLGDALIAATDANTKYTDSIKALTTYTKPSDMMLSRVGDATSITGKSDGTVNSAMLEVLQKMWKELQNQTTIAQLNRGMA